MTAESGPGRVDDVGLRVEAPAEGLVDVFLDERRIWSFRPRDVAARDGDLWVVPWPTDLVPFLVGEGRVTVRVPDDEAPAFDGVVRLGGGSGPISVVDSYGRPMVVESSGRLAVIFGSDAVPDRVLDTVEDVLGRLNAAGVSAFPAYGTLLGAVRDGALIGHDSDADLAYISEFSAPVDVMRESFRLQRLLERAGYRTMRYSGGAIKIEVVEEDGFVRGVDVFSGFLLDGHLGLMGELFVPFEREWLLPLGTMDLAGRTLSVPAEPERLLEATYGPSWRVPDPAFRYEKPEATDRRLSNWFRGTRVKRPEWDRRYSMARFTRPAHMGPHALAQHLAEREGADTTVVEVGCGRGQDAYWLAGRGHRTYAFDFASAGYAALDAAATAEGRPVSYHTLNLLDLRHTLAWGARLSRLTGPRAMLARHVLDATNIRGRRHLFRLARMTLGGGGRLYADIVTGDPHAPSLAGTLLYPLDPELVAEEAAELGGRVVEAEQVTTEHTGQPPVGASSLETTAYRMVMEWGA